jgi:hypothetical protein
MPIPRLVKDIATGDTVFGPQDLTALGNLLYFTAEDGISGRELWKSDGTAAGTVRVRDIKTGNSSSFRDERDEDENQLVVVGSTLFFVAKDDRHGRELWKSDGTEAGTVLVKDIRSGDEDSDPTNLMLFGNTLYFRADDGSGMELWKSDGTETGTQRVKNINPGSVGSFPYGLTGVGNTLYFVAFDSDSGEELWKTNGTEAGTVRVKDIHTDFMGAYPEYLTVMGNTLYFTADDMIRGRELWKSDGTEVGTDLVKDINFGYMGSDPEELTVIGNTLYFTADGTLGGRELWKSDGTEIGTVLVKDINRGIDSSLPSYLTAVGNKLFFTARDPLGGEELWTSDGTTAGTVRVKDIRPGNNGSNPYLGAVLGNTLFFAANDGTTGDELWASDGTEAGTFRVADLNKRGSSGSNPSNFQVVGDTLFFTADNGEKGEELWAIDALPLQAVTPAPPPPPVVSLALSPSSVTEDGSTNLLYTFSRTGSTSAPLTVNYTVGGTATLGVDTTGIAATPSTKSITFAAGSTSATVRVDPTADRNQEANETVALRLLAGTEYTLGTTSAVTGTILNDDLIGTSARNTITGTAIAEFIDGLQANDILTGGVGPDVFGFRYSHSTLTTPDRITDFRFGSDKIDLFTASGGNLAAPAGFTRASNNSTARTLSDLAAAVFRDANGAIAGNQALGANRAALVVASKSSIRGTYLFINDGSAARSNSSDLLINLTGHSGALPGLGGIGVGTVFA